MEEQHRQVQAGPEKGRCSAGMFTSPTRIAVLRALLHPVRMSCRQHCILSKTIKRALRIRCSASS